MKERKCNLCKEKKSLNDFANDKSRALGKSYRCKKCHQKEYKEKYYEKHLISRKGKYNEYYKERYKNLSEKDKKEMQNKINQWQRDNKDKVAGYKRKYRSEKPLFRLKENIRTRIYLSLKGENKGISTSKLLGCSIEEYKLYLERKFDSKMNWENYGTYWEIDHIKELHRYDLTDPLQIKEAFHFTNTQPLSIKENRSKR